MSLLLQEHPFCFCRKLRAVGTALPQGPARAAPGLGVGLAGAPAPRERCPDPLRRCVLLSLDTAESAGPRVARVKSTTERGAERVLTCATGHFPDRGRLSALFCVSPQACASSGSSHGHSIRIEEGDVAQFP